MHNLKPITDLKNYERVLSDVGADSPVYLTKNGKECFVIADMRDYEKQKASLQLLIDLLDGEISAQTRGWLESDKIRARHGL